MFFTKYPSPANFTFLSALNTNSQAATFGDRQAKVHLAAYEDGVYNVRLENAEIWSAYDPICPLTPPPAADGCLSVDAQNGLTICNEEGEILLRSVTQAGIGLSGEDSLFQFEVTPEARFYGMGQKTFGRIELSGLRTCFWNTDVWSDFHFAQWGSYPTDPPYFSLPYLAMNDRGRWIGFLLPNPSPAYMETPGTDESRVFVEWQRTSPNLIMGNRGGEPNLWIIVADSLAELTRRLQRLVGVTPRPPLWALGYHQSRWGYGGHDDLLKLDREFAKRKIPCSGLWLDLDYMDGFRIFQTNPEMFPKGVQATADALAKNGRRIVPIIDPGVKFEPGYRVYDDGHKRKVFCLNAEGREYIGMVWPGQTVFPDFIQASVREWWAGYAKEFLEEGYGAAWVDMNDPSTGPVDPNDMRFKNGMASHAAHRNEYALGMQMATFDGFLKARPNERPFLLSRSGFVGSSRYSAIWTGDNVANDFYLQNCVPTSLGMSISGLPFNGPDIGGFGGNSSENLMVRWMQACFLFPFCRNHTNKDSDPQEPFAYSKDGESAISHFIRLRYQFLPYLYQLFIEQERTGEAILRPLLYDFADAGLDEISDQYLIGPAILQAPILEAKGKRRKFVLPGNRPWLDARNGEWRRAGRHQAKVALEESLMFLREGSVIPVQPELPKGNDVNLAAPRFLIVAPAKGSGKTSYRYTIDDGLSYDYRGGAQSVIELEVAFDKGVVSVTTSGEPKDASWMPQVALLGGAHSLSVNGRAVNLRAELMTISGSPIELFVAKSLR